MNRFVILLALLSLLFVPVVNANEKDLNGTWLAQEATQNGMKVADDFAKSAKLVFADGKYTASLDQITETGTFKVDRAKKPNTLDMKASSGQKKGKAMQGIFELEGDTLKVCFNLESSERPKDSTSTAANKHFVVVYKRKQ